MAELDNLPTPASLTEPDASGAIKAMFKKFLASNPFYLTSAGLLLYGINQITTDTKWLSTELPMLKFNFCALLIYEIMLVCTAITLARRHIWYDALLLFGLANLFIIVPFSLVSRTIFISYHPALTMTLSGAGLAVATFWAFKSYVPELNLPRRLLFFGALLLLANAYAPLLFFKADYNPLLIKKWLDYFWLIVFPAFAVLANFIPRTGHLGDSPGQRRWLPMVIYLGWFLVTGCHLGGLGYCNSFVWSNSLLVPAAWVIVWSIQFRLAEFVTRPILTFKKLWSFVPLAIPLLAVDSPRLLVVFAVLNLIAYGIRFGGQPHRRLALIQMLTALTMVLSALPLTWVSGLLPEVTREEWIYLSAFTCFSWLIFLSRDPRLGLVVALSVSAGCINYSQAYFFAAVQVALVTLLAHSLRWDEQVHRGTAFLRHSAGVLWTLCSYVCFNAFSPPLRLLVVLMAVALLSAYVLRGLIWRHWKPVSVGVYASLVLTLQPAMWTTEALDQESPGILAIAVSFLLFGLGSAAAFSKTRRQPPK
jgi:hypothetical protein